MDTVALAEGAQRRGRGRVHAASHLEGGGVAQEVVYCSVLSFQARAFFIWVIDSFIRHECVLRLLHAMVLIGCIGLVLISFAYCLSGVLRTALLGSVQVVEIQSVHMPRRCSWMKLLLVFPCGVWHTVVADGCREG